jgi:transcriptional regulator with XRE-family HTH domain
MNRQLLFPYGEGHQDGHRTEPYQAGEAAGLTQMDLGRALGFPGQNAQMRISQYETGKRSPGKQTMERIATILHVPVDALFLRRASEPVPVRYQTDVDKELALLCDEGRKYGAENIRTVRKMLPIMFRKKGEAK